jgi:hypothetical protein
MQIWKFVLEVDGKQAVEMPKDANVLCVQAKDGQACLWAEVEPKAPKEKRIFEVFPTGIDLPCNGGPFHRKYIGTFQVGSIMGTLVFHVYERLN